ncbi:MAG: hypothetical protein LBP72_06570 [Dysgonamonadaceae bacterium]|jgi:hypothetical protein|nr:hypothetical protein [Dysgonamonadaceae bacterium]
MSYAKRSFPIRCLKGNIFITAGHRPAAGSKTAATLPERQDFHNRRSSTCGRKQGGWTDVSLSAGHRPAVMEITSFQDFTKRRTESGRPIGEVPNSIGEAPNSDCLPVIAGLTP